LSRTPRPAASIIARMMTFWGYAYYPLRDLYGLNVNTVFLTVEHSAVTEPSIIKSNLISSSFKARRPRIGSTCSAQHPWPTVLRYQPCSRNNDPNDTSLHFHSTGWAGAATFLVAKSDRLPTTSHIRPTKRCQSYIGWTTRDANWPCWLLSGLSQLPHWLVSETMYVASSTLSLVH